MSPPTQTETIRVMPKTPFLTLFADMHRITIYTILNRTIITSSVFIEKVLNLITLFTCLQITTVDAPLDATFLTCLIFDGKVLIQLITLYTG